MKIQQLNSNIKTSFSQSNLEEKELKTIVDFFKSNYSLIEIIKFLNQNKSLKNISPTTYSMGDNILFIGQSNLFETPTEIFKKLKKLKITSAPEHVASAKSAGGQYSLLILKTPCLKEGNAEFSKNKNTVSFENRAKFVQDLIKLEKETSLYNPQILENPSSLFVSKKSEIFVQDWNDLRTFNSQSEKISWFNQLRKKLNLNTH